MLMTVLRGHTALEDKVNYVATLAFLCGISCMVLMLKFRGFKASLNFYNGKRKSKEREDLTPVSMSGAYRTNRDEFFGYSNNIEPQRKLTSASTSEPLETPLRSVKSTSDLTKHKNLPPALRQTHPSISRDPRGEPPQPTRDADPKKDRRKLDAEKKVEKQRQLEQKKQEKQRLEDEKKLEKQRTEERKLRERQAAFDQARQDKLRKEEEKRQAEQLKRDRKKKGAAPKPIANPLAQNKPQHSSNTLESSISRTSGPPPYSEVPKPEQVQNIGDVTGNISFSKPIDTGSWDMISQHRQHINRTVQATPDRKQVVMDLKYNFDSPNDTVDNSEV